MKAPQKPFNLDIHGHGPWPFWSEQKGFLSKIRKKLDNAMFPHEKRMETLLDLYLPKVKEENVAIGFGSYTLNRFEELVNPLHERKEQQILKSLWNIKDIDMTNSDYYVGFKMPNGNEFYVVGSQEVMVPEGHFVLFPMTNPIPYKNESGKFKTLEETVTEAKKNQNVDPLVFLAHQGLKSGMIGKTVLLALRETAWRNGMSMEEEVSESYFERGLIDAVSSFESQVDSAPLEENAKRVYEKWGIPSYATSDTASESNILTSYMQIGLDFYSPQNLRNSLKENLMRGEERGYKNVKNQLKGGKAEQIKHIMGNLVNFPEKLREEI